jgi:exonuclease SbcC
LDKKKSLQQRQHIIDAGKETKQKTESFEQQIQAIGQDEVFQGQITQVPEPNQRGVLVEQLKQDFQQKIDFHQQHIAQFETQKALQAYANALHDDEPCPLCGAIHHPDKLTSSEDFSQKYKQKRQAKKCGKIACNESSNSMRNGMR